jgi:type IV pilus assembly protein PilV
MTMKIQRRQGRSIAARWQRGLTMIEVLVAIVVLAIGLLGLAGLQLNGLKVSQGSTFRWKASQLAADLADQLRASRVESTAAPGPCTLTAAGGIQGTCPTGLLATSLPLWAASQLVALPGAIASFSINGNNVWEVDIAWDDTHAAQIGTAALAAPTQPCGATGAALAGCFTLLTQI